MTDPETEQAGSPRAPVALQAATVLASLAAIAFLASRLAMQPAAGPPRADQGLTPPQLRPCATAPPGYLRGQLYGSLELGLDWTGARLKCDGMRRPGERGFRLLFAPADGGLLVVIGLDGDPGGLAGREVPANLTIVDEKRGLFFSTAGEHRCWARIAEAAARGPSKDAGWYLRGLVFCNSALPAINQAGHVTPGELRFGGHLPPAAE